MIVRRMPEQMALPLSLDDQPRLDNLIVGRNAVVFEHLQALIEQRFEPMCLYVWGATGSGKTHILRSLTVAEGAVLLSHEDLQHSIAWEAHRWFLVDDVQNLNRKGQEHLFHLFNAIRAERVGNPAYSKHLIVTADCAPVHLPADFLPDLRTRLGWDLVYELQVLSDEEKAEVLIEQAQQRGLQLGHGVVDYLLRYLSRDLSRLHEFLVQLDDFGLQKKQAITLPLVKQWLSQSQQMDG